MKILLVTSEDPGKPYGGLGTFVRNLSKHLGSRHVVSVLFLQSAVQWTEKGAASDLVTWTIFTEDLEEQRLKCHEIVSDFKPDVIHCNDFGTWPPFRNFTNVIFSLHLSVPDLVGLKGLNLSLFHNLQIEKEACQHSAAVVVYSDFYRQRVLDQISFTADPRVLPLGVDQDDVEPQKSQDKIVVSYFGRLVNWQKGVSEFSKAVESLDTRWVKEHKLEFNIYGHSPHPYLYSKLKGVNIKQVAFIEGQELKRAYEETHIVVMPSKYEPFGLVGLEAMSHACLLLCPSGLGMDEYFRPGINGVEIESSAFSICEGLMKVIRSWPRYQILAREGFRTARLWTWERCARRHERVYAQVMDEGWSPYEISTSV